MLILITILRQKGKSCKICKKAKSSNVILQGELIEGEAMNHSWEDKLPKNVFKKWKSVEKYLFKKKSFNWIVRFSLK